MSNGKKKYYDNCPEVRQFSGFLNYINQYEFKNESTGKTVTKLVAKVNANISVNANGEYRKRGENFQFGIEIPPDHEANLLVARLREEGKLDSEGRVAQGTIVWLSGGGLKISFHPRTYKNRDGEDVAVAEFRGRLAPWSKLTLERPQFGGDDTLNPEVSKSVEDTSF